MNWSRWMPRPLSWLALAMGLLVMSGCEQMEKSMKEMKLNVSLPKMPDLPTLDQLGQKLKGGSGSDAAATVPAPAAAPLDLSPDFLVGLTPSQVQAILGPAVSAKNVNGTVIWGYGNATCGLDVYFPSAAGDARALAVEPRTDRQSADAGQHCFAHLRHH